jgi:hypothetical protein
MMKLFSRTIRPFRKSTRSDEAHGGTYEQGWNDCLDTIKNAEARWFRSMDEEMKTKVIPFRKR